MIKLTEENLLYWTKFCKLLSKITGTRKLRNYYIRKRLKKYEFSVFSNNCIGGVFLHDAGKRFNSPTVNLSTDGEGFIKFLNAPQDFVDGDFEFVNQNYNPHPHGILHGMLVNFVHYKTFEDGVEKWKLRSKRICWDHIYIVATGHDGMEVPELMEQFDKIPYKNKVMFTFGKWNQYEWAKQVKCAHGVKRPFTEFATLTGKRFYETAFDLAKWISQCEQEMRNGN